MTDPITGNPNPITDPSPDGEATVSMADVLRMQQEHKAEVEKLRTDMTTQYNESLKMLVQDRQQAQPQVQVPTLSSEDLKEIIETGEGTEKILEYMNATVKAQTDKIIQEQIDPLRQEGAAALTTMAQTQAAANPAMPYYGRFEKEIQEQLSLLGNPAQRANPKAIKAAYDMTVGKHMDVLMKEKQEEFLRQATTTPGTTTPGQAPTRSQEPQEITPKTMQDSLSYDALEKIHEKGWDENKYALASGFKSWEDMEYFKQDKDPNKSNYYKMLAERRANAAA